MIKYVSLLALGITGVALAQAPSFEDIDANKDGVITRAEFRSGAVPTTGR